MAFSIEMKVSAVIFNLIARMHIDKTQTLQQSKEYKAFQIATGFQFMYHKS